MYVLTLRFCTIIFSSSDSSNFHFSSVPTGPIHHEASYKRQPRYKGNFISLFDMMKRFQQLQPQMEKIAAIGFKRKGQKPVSKQAYERRHVVSAGFFNVDRMNENGSCFNPDIWAMEDLDFNLRVSGVQRTVNGSVIHDDHRKSSGLSAGAALVVRCNRYLQYKVNFKTGGCVDQTQMEVSDITKLFSILERSGYDLAELTKWAETYPKASKSLGKLKRN